MLGPWSTVCYDAAMAVDVTFLGHAGFLLTDGTHTLAIDPFLTGNPSAVHKPEEIRCDYIGLTHGHADHFGDTMAIAEANGATVIAPNEICEHLNETGYGKTEPGNPGGRILTPFGYVGFTPAFHSSSLEGKYMGPACGLTAQIGQVTFYHCGDTALFSDMKLIGQIVKPDVAMIPVGDRFTMGPKLGKMAAEFIAPTYAIPVHYGTWPLLTDDITDFAPEGVQVQIMQAGETWHLDP